MTIYRDAKHLVRNISEWITERLRDSGKSGGIVGLSGGIDSAVVAGLLKMVCGNRMLAVIMPCHSAGEDLEDAMKVVEEFNLPWLKVELTETYDTLLRALPFNISSEQGLHLANLKPRLRMTTLYCIGQLNNLIVCGTGNKAEISLGYFTKYGDSGVDILPLGDLLKGEVLQIARELGVPPGIIKKPPSAGLLPGQTDEEELGLTYLQIDRYLATGDAEQDVAKRIESAFTRSAHKRTSAPICIIDAKLAERQE
ncbi:MAG: NAD(+) synthase [Thermovirgaceae bacterium]|nr:NAD(+) synthase [Thermovirgaceae bacterium]